MTCSDSRPISPMLLGDRDEAVGLDHPAQRMVPARQHFEADDLAGREVHLRLEEGHELVMLEAVADALLDLAVGDQRALHAARRTRPAAPTRPLLAWSSAMSARRSRSGMRTSVAGADGDAGEGADLDQRARRSRTAAVTACSIASASALDFAACSASSASATANSSPLKPGDQSASGRAPRSSAAAIDPQQRVADVIAVAVVDRLEAVELEREDRPAAGRVRPRAGARSSPRSANPLRLSRPVMPSVEAMIAARALAFGAQLGFVLQVDIAPPAEQDQRDVEGQRDRRRS